MRMRLKALLLLPALAVGGQRPSAPWPPPEGPLHVIIDSDTACEVDDQYALALALASPQRIQLEAIVAAHFGDAGGPTGVEKSYQEIQRVLERAGRKVQVKRGAEPFTFLAQPPDSEGVRFIIERARAATPEQPLWLVLLGPATDAVAALSLDPSIADRLVVFWHGRTQWPVRCWNFNAHNDVKAARMLFDLPCRFILFDTGTYITMSMEEGARRIAPLGPLGEYLQRIRYPAYQSPKKGMFDLGDITALVDPASVRWERTEAPAVDFDLRYDFSKKQGEIVRIYFVERDRAFDLLEEGLRKLSRR